MLLYPAIDILEGRAVRLLYGKRDRVTDFGDPVDCAKRWVDAGAQSLHVVDLSGAFSSPSDFNTALEKIAALGVSVQSGGGLRSTETIMRRFAAGAERVVIGTLAVEEPEIFRTAVERYGDRIVLGLDVKDKKVCVRGWTEQSPIDAFAFACKAKEMGVSSAVYTDVSRDGALTGADREGFSLMKKSGLSLIASGGIKDIDDLLALKALGADGAILGRAIYTGAIDFAEAAEAVK